MSEELDRHFAAVVEHPLRVANPLPDLRAGDFGGGGVFHQVVERHAAPSPPSQASRYCTPTLMLVRSPASVMVPFGNGEQVGGGDVHVLALAVDLVGLGHHARRRPPWRSRTRPGCATQVPSWPSVASRSLSARTFASAASLACRVVLDGDLGRHAAHRVRVAPVAGLDAAAANTSA